MESTPLLEALDHEGALLVAAARRTAPDALVPSCPGWTAADLFRHVGLVHRWADAVVRAAGPEIDQDDFDAGSSLPPDSALADWVEEGHRRLVGTLTSLPEDYQCWTLWPAGPPRHFWIRRQLHETAVHRMDAELAAGGALSVMPTGPAADGLDELLTGLLPFEPFYSSADWRLAAHAQDADLGWTATIGPHPPVVVPELQPAACTLTGDADALYGYLWNRRRDGVEVTGDADLAELWRTGVRIRR